ncbi:hypothetical protein GUJ93_ZPchr0005g14436 [Zizania palustris]|uniref:Uncharacterized protein n=1 Tax=Zizania palustris TaxID=103762 RepID=A0A8J5S4B2_ZIZPA|nr:hypothetical protein GUJ93_ZPchr0005g14436 [Zizania palustris]
MPEGESTHPRWEKVGALRGANEGRTPGAVVEEEDGERAAHYIGSGQGGGIDDGARHGCIGFGGLRIGIESGADSRCNGVGGGVRHRASHGEEEETEGARPSLIPCERNNENVVLIRCVIQG